MSIRKRTAEILEVSHASDRIGRMVDVFLITLITLNVVAIIFESVADIHQAHRALFWNFEVFSVTVFSIEYLLRVWSCIDEPEVKDASPFIGRIKYMLTPLAIIDLIAILPFFLGLYLSLDLRFLRVLRLLRLFKLTRYSTAMGALLDVLQEEAHTLVAAFVVLLMMLVISASGIYLLEHKVQPEHFGSIPAAMWWSIITLTTVGYGDITPITPMGKFFGGIISLIGVGMVALPAAILASGFAENLRMRRIQYNAFIKHALSDGKLDDQERWELEELREELGLSKEDSIHLIDKLMRNYIKHKDEQCPHCGKPLDIGKQQTIDD